MTAKQPRHLVLASAGLAALLATAMSLLRTEDPTKVATPVIAPSACSSCDARHARLQSLRTDPLKVNE